MLVGTGTWIRTVDPIATAFRFYGRVAPLAWEHGRLTLSIPGMRLVPAVDPDDGDGRGAPGSVAADGRLVSGLDDVAIAVALVWALTFSRFVTTEQGATAARAVAALRVPPIALPAPLSFGV